MKKKARFTDLSQVLKKIPNEKRAIAERMIEELLFMEDTLTELKKVVRESGAVELFEQGSQSFLRESPALKSYNSTLQKYLLLQKNLFDLVGVLPEEEKENPIYEFIREGVS